MSTKVIMPSDRVRMSPSTYREYSLSYRELANLMRKTSEDTAKIVPIPSNMWDGEAPQRFTAMMTQVTGAASTVADAAMIISAYYANLAESASNANMQLKALEARFRACESQIKDAQKHSGGFSISGAIDWVDDKMSKSPDELRSSQRQIAAVMSDVHEEWQRLDAAMSSDIRNRFIPVLQAALDMLPFKFRTENMPATSTPPKPSTVPGSIRAAEAAEAIRNEKSKDAQDRQDKRSWSAGIAVQHARSLYPGDEEKQNEFVENYVKKVELLAASRGVSTVQITSSTLTTNMMPPPVENPDELYVPDIVWPENVDPESIGHPAVNWDMYNGSWRVQSGDSLWMIATTTLRMAFFIEPTPLQVKTYVKDIKSYYDLRGHANLVGANPESLRPGKFLGLPVPSFLQTK